MRYPNEPDTCFGDAEFLEKEIARTREADLMLRLQAIRYRMLEKTVNETCELLCIHPDTLRKWVLKWNDSGIKALRTKPRSGRPRKLNNDCKNWIINQIGGTLNDAEPFTALAIHGYLKKYSIDAGYSTVCRNLNEWGYCCIRPRQMAALADQEWQKQFVEHVKPLINNDKIDLWFQDETAFWADPATYYVWAKKGSKPTVPRLVSHMHANIMGAVRPSDGKFFAFIASHGNKKLFQIFLDKMQEQINPDRKTIMIMDNAKFHKVEELRWGNIEPLYLPPYSPKLNPIETLWLVMKKRFSNGWIPKNETDLHQRAFNAINYYRDRNFKVKAACAITTYL